MLRRLTFIEYAPVPGLLKTPFSHQRYLIARKWHIYHSNLQEGTMALVRKSLALLAWIIIEIPTTLFVVFVMIKVYLEERNSKRRTKRGYNVKRA